MEYFWVIYTAQHSRCKALSILFNIPLLKNVCFRAHPIFKWYSWNTVVFTHWHLGLVQEHSDALKTIRKLCQWPAPSRLPLGRKATILQTLAISSGLKLCGWGAIFQQDNDPKHASKLCLACLMSREQKWVLICRAIIPHSFQISAPQNMLPSKAKHNRVS